MLTHCSPTVLLGEVGQYAGSPFMAWLGMSLAAWKVLDHHPAINEAAAALTGPINAVQRIVIPAER